MSEPPTLALSGSNPTGQAPFSCCLRVRDQLYTACSPTGQRGDLATLASNLLTEHGLTPQDIGQLRIDLGPGSYTGLRVAITFARFLQHFGNVPVHASDTLALLASAGPTTPGRFRPLLDARRGRFHCGTLADTNGTLTHLIKPRAIPLDEVLATIESGDTFVIAPTLDEKTKAALQDSAAVHIATNVTAENLFSPSLQLATCTTTELEPRYLMGTYAD